MSARHNNPIVVLFFLILLSTLDAQTIKTPYLAQFPAIERVRNEIKGKDATDTAAKHVGAFWQLQNIVKEMSGGRQYRNQLTPEEGRLIGLYRLGYQQAETQIPPNLDKARWHQAYSKYHYDDSLREEIFEKLLSPQIRDQWAQTTDNLDRRVKANQKVRDDAIKAEGGPFQRASAGSGQGAKTAAAIGAVDPSIAKAKAARVDTSIVGLQLGEPLVLPECDPLGFDSRIDAASNRATVRNTCIYKGFDLGALGIPDVTTIFGIETDKSGVAEVVTVRLSKNYCPTWVEKCAAYATVHGGRLSGVALFTPGKGYDRTITSDLSEKYGPPTRVVNGRVTPDTGNAFQTSEPEWTLPGLYVEYEVVLRDENAEGRISDYRQGVVRIMTESERERRIAKQKFKSKVKL